MTGWSGGGSITGNGGSDTIVAVRDADFTLTDSSLSTSDGMSLSLSGIGAVNLTGGASANTFDVGGWSAKGKLIGNGGADTVVATHSGDFTLANASLKFATASFSLTGIGTANLTGDSGANNFTVTAWTGQASIDGAGGSDTVTATKGATGAASFTLMDTSLTTSDGMSVSLTNVGNAKLTGGSFDDTFDVSAWTGGGKVTGGVGNDFMVSDIGGSTALTVSLTKTALTVSGRQPLALSTLESVRIVGSSASDSINASTFNGRTTLAGGAGHDTLTGGVGNDVLLGGSGGDSLIGGNGRDIIVGGDDADAINGGNGDDILIGGNVTYGDAAYSAYDTILAEWLSADDYATRISKIQSGTLAGGVKLDSSTVIDEAAADVVIGGTTTSALDPTNRDWFLVHTTGGDADTTPDVQGDETVTSI